MLKKEERLLRILLIYIILQPFLDVLSYLSIREIIPFNISTYVKPIFVFSLGGYLLFRKYNNRRYWYIYIFLFGILVIGHTYLLSKLLVSTSVIIHELRFLINIAYMGALFIITRYICQISSEKEELLRRLKKTILITFCIYFTILGFAIITGTSAKTYEYADINKLGYKGWFDSGQILGHAFSIVFPVLIYVILSPKRKWYYRVIIMLLFIIGVSLIGTKVPYYITFIVCILYLIINVLIRIFNKEHRTSYFNVIFVLLVVIEMVVTYKYTPVKYNTDINNRNAENEIDEYDIEDESGLSSLLTLEELKEKYPNEELSEIIKYQSWSKEASNYLEELFIMEKLHPSNMRFKQINYAHKKFLLADIKYKIFGLGFLNQDTSLAIESDFLMALYSFGILGFILFLLLPLKEFFKTTFFILRNLKIIDLETYMLYMGLGIFFCISICAGYTYIYPNFSIFLVLLLAMLDTKKYLLMEKIINPKKITFLSLHLGYGGIETSIVNTANALCGKYQVEIISFYQLENNQAKRLDERVLVKYLYYGEPNRCEFLFNVKKKNLLGILREGFKALDILIKKRVLIMKEIIFTDARYMVSTRWEFSVLLSRYGKENVVKIAEEHRYHNNEIKYINTIKKKYYNIDYIFALTETLYHDYQVFLKHNHHTEVILMPNMLESYPDATSSLKQHVLITMGRLDVRKKNDDIIRAFAKTRHHGWHLNILGDGSEEDNLRNLIKELKMEDDISLVGYVPKDKLSEYLVNASCFLMASLTEGLPMVLLEAMSYGLPCIAFETASGVNDIIKDGVNGYVIKNRNMDEYVIRLQEVMDSEKLRRKLGNEALATSKKNSVNKIRKKWYNFLDK